MMLTMDQALIGLLANSNTDDRAVCTGLRNFLRTVGGSFGLIGMYLLFFDSRLKSSDAKQPPVPYSPIP
jgi:hypothetical protein